jgi:Gluconate 2-dehydrogenase subunit 3
MGVTIIPKDDLYVLNQCTKYLARAGDPPAPGDEEAATAFRARISEAWRFPVIDVSRGDPTDDDPDNEVTFIYKDRPGSSATVAVAGTFANLYDPIPLEPVLFLGEDTGYRALTVVVPKGEHHTYKYRVDGRFVLDPINPQRSVQPNGQPWSRFFTDSYLQPLVLELWELQILYRLTEQILPFRTQEAEVILQRFYYGLDQGQKRSAMDSKVYRLDRSVGEVNAIDKMLAREEAHRLADYKICLKQIDRVLRRRDPYQEPADMSKEYYIDLYNDMASNRVDGWDYGAYADPKYFLYILRRHTVTAAFSHPRYSGNVGAAGWAYLGEKYLDATTGTSLFDWRAALEPPLGTNVDYR